MKPDFKQQMRLDCEKIEQALAHYLPKTEENYHVIYDAAHYSLMAGGKRIRPFLTLSFCRLFGGDEALALRFGCALEMIHTYSLIHDDLPCMDNDTLRRGKPTNHVIFGEDMALLAGDTLLTQAFAVASGVGDPVLCCRAVQILSEQAGINGMIGGQVLDLLGEKEHCDFETLLSMHEKKTTALIRAACLLGCVSAGVTEPQSAQMRAACDYAHGIGLTFQIVDDLLDRYGDTALLGKHTGGDAENGKTTFLSFMDAEQAKAYAQELTEKAKTALAPYPENETLCALADYLLTRNS